MPRLDYRHFAAPVLTALTFGLIALTFASVGVEAALSVGDIAPAVELNTLNGETLRFDETTSRPQLLLFCKPNDKYTKVALDDVDRLLARYPAFSEGVERALIVSLLEDENGAEVEQPEYLRSTTWPVLFDRENSAYHGYKIIATPTITIVNVDRSVAAVHAGYDNGLAQDVRLTLAKMLNVELPATAYHKAAAPNLKLQMARNMFDRKRWPQARRYFLAVEKEAPLSPSDALALTRAMVELKEYDEALQRLDALAPLNNLGANDLATNDATTSTTTVSNKDLDELRAEIARRRSAVANEISPPKIP